MREIIGIVSGKGGVGKTTTTVNLGMAMHKLGENVVIVDGDLKNPNFGIHLGIFNYDTTLNEAIERDMPLLEALHIHETGLRFIPAHISLHYLDTDPGRLKNMFEMFDSKVLIDAPPGLGEGSMAVMEACDKILAVTGPQLPDLTDCMKTIEVARDMGKGIAGIVLNSLRYEDYEIPSKEIEAITNLKIIQKIPWDENVLKSVARKKPLVDLMNISPAAICYYELASKLTGKEYKKPLFLDLRRFFARRL
jgi:septum site-determining protein MinD